MPMQWQKIPIPAAQGPDEATHEWVRSPAALDVLNGYWARSGEIRTRGGYDALTSATEGSIDIEGARGIFSTGEELCLIGKRRLWAYHAHSDQWLDRGPVAPCTARSGHVFREATSLGIGDLAVASGVVLHLAPRRYALDTSSRQALVVEVYSVDGQTHRRHTYAGAGDTATTADKPHSVRACHVGTTKLLGFYAKGTDTPNPADLVRYYEYDTSTSTETIVPANVTTDLWIDDINDVRTYDVCPVASSNYLVAWIDDTAQNINLRRFNSSHAQQATGTISAEAPFFRVAICDDPSLDQVYVLALALNGENGNRLLLYARKRSDLTAVWGPVTVDTSSLTEAIDTLGVAAGGAITRVECTWTLSESPSGDGPRTALCEDSRDTAGAGASNIFRSFGLAARSRPFFQDNHCYIVGVTTCSTQIHATNDIFDVGGQEVQTAAFESHLLLELFHTGVNATTQTKQPVLCGVWDVGQAIQLEYLAEYGNTGCGNNVETEASGIFRTSTNSMAYVLRSPTAGPLAAVDEVTFDFTEAPTAALVNQGSAVIGGAYVTSYDGEYATELGFVVAPFPYDNITTSDTASGSLVPGDSYQWIAIWKDYDRHGNIARSIPCAPVTVTMPAAPSTNDTATLRFKTTMATNRCNVTRHSVEVYRADDDAVYKRVSEPKRYIENRAIAATGITGNYVTVDFVDNGLPQGDELYTTSGEIEAVCPEGARIVATGIGRVWLGDLVRRARIQYSKPIAPGTAFEDAIAPEFNEGFGYLLESGERVTGIGELDDKMVVFTESSIFIIVGRGPDDAGAQNDFSGLVLVSNDAGCIEPRSVVGFPGGVLFRSAAGIMRLDRSLAVEFVGGAVRDQTDAYPEVTSAVLVAERTQVRFTVTDSGGTDAQVLVYDYRVGQWSRWVLTWDDAGTGRTFVPVGACLHGGAYYVVNAAGMVLQETYAHHFDDSIRFVGLDITMGWLQTAGQNGWQRARKLEAQCKWHDPHKLTLTVYENMEAAAIDSEPWTHAEVLTFPHYTEHMEVAKRITRQKCKAVRARIRSAADATTSPVTGEGFSFMGFVFEAGQRRGLEKQHPSVQER